MTSAIVDPIGLNDADFENQRPSKAEYDIKGLALMGHPAQLINLSSVKELVVKSF